MSIKDDLIGSKGGSSTFRNRPDNLRSTDTFEALIGLCSGRIKGLAPGGLQNLMVDDVPIEDGSGNTTLTDFNAILFDGDPTILQPIQLQLGGSSGAQNVNLPLNNANQGTGTGTPGDWRYGTVPQGGVDYIDLRFIINGLFRQDKKGIYDATASIEIELQASGSSQWINPLASVAAPTYNKNGIKLAGYSGVSLYVMGAMYADANTWYDPAPGFLQVTGKTSQAYVKELRIAVPNTGNYANKTWQVRARLRERDSYTNDQDQESRSIQWESLAGVSMAPIGNREEWRGLAYLHVNGKASDQLSGVPTITGIYDLSTVRVPPASVWNAETRTYTGTTWDGATEEVQWTQCPAFQIKDLVEDGVSGISALVPGSTLNKWDALEASKWYAQRVSDGQGGTQPRYSMNYLLDSALSVNDLMQYVAGAVGSYAWDEGDGKWRLVVEKPENATALFTKENIVGEFNYAHTDVDTRYNDMIGVYRSEARGFDEDRVRVFDQAHIDNFGRRATSVALVGCTNRQEALRRIKIRQLTSLNETRQVSFVTNRQGNMVQPFSVILVADGDLAGDTSIRTTGRLVANSGTNLTVRDTMRLELGISYKIHVTIPNPAYNPASTAQPGSPDWRKPTITITRNVTNAAGARGDVTSIQIDSALPANTPVNAPIAFEAVGLPTLPKQYRVLDVENQDDEMVSISAIEIYTNKWNESDAVNEADILAQRPNKTIPAPTIPETGMFSVKTYEAEFQTKRVLTVTWDRPGSIWIDGFKVEFNLNNGPWQTLTENTQDNYVELQQPQNGLYTFRISTVDRRGGYSAPLISTYQLEDTAADYAPVHTRGLLRDRPTAGGREGDKYTTTDQSPNLTFIWSKGQWYDESTFVKDATDIKYVDPATGQETVPVQSLMPAQAGADVTGDHTSKDTNAVGGRPATQIVYDISQLTTDVTDLYAALGSSQDAEHYADAAQQYATDSATAATQSQAARDVANQAKEAASGSATTATNAKNDAVSAFNAADAARALTVGYRDQASQSVTDANTAKTAAQTAATASQTSASNASGFASTASGQATIATQKADAAGTSASNASASASTATTQAGQASTSASNAATSASNALGSANSASTQAGVAVTSAGQTLPQFFDASLTHFGTAFASATATTPTVSGVGTVLELSGTNYAYVWGLNGIAISAGMRVRFTIGARVRSTSTGTGSGTLGLSVGVSDQSRVTARPTAASSGVTIVANPVYPADDVWRETIIDYVVPATPPAGFAFPVVLAYVANQVPSRIVQLRYVRVEDVTSLVGSAASATAAATSASNAATSQSAAGTSATAANTSATNASTSAGQASTFANNASTSATNAAGSANTATTQAGVAATSATSANARLAEMMPSQINLTATGWTLADSGSPSTVPVVTPSLITFANNRYGVNAGSSGYIRSAQVLPATTGAVYEVSAEVELTFGGASGAVYPMAVVRGLNSSFAGLGDQRTYNGKSWATTGTTTLTAVLRVSDVADASRNILAWPSGSVWLRIGGGWAQDVTGSSGRTMSVTVRDVTAEVNSSKSASAAAGSASTASASQTAAGQSASAAQASAATASTKAGEASASSASAATSESNALGSKNAAASSASLAATARDDAVTAKNAAGASASAAASSASAASASKDAAGSSASSAQTSATNANTSAGQASTSASNASTSASNAQGFSNSASAAQLVAASSATQAMQTVASDMPSDFSQGELFWMAGYLGDSNNRPSAAGWTFPTVTGEGIVAQSPASTGGVDISHRSITPSIPGRKYRVTVRAKSVSAAAGLDVFQAVLASQNATSVIATQFVKSSTLTSAFADYTVDFDGTNAPYQRILARIISRDGSSQQGQISRISLIDVTELVASQAAATASAGSASLASTKADAASSSASAALASQTAANTSAGNASTSASQASTSATNAQGSANSAVTAQGAAAASRDAAANSASAAAGSASSAATSKDAASQSASAANTFATNANTSAGNASTSAGQASTSASNAQGYANSASASQQLAANNAGTATQAKNDAQSFATAASGSATTASTKAGEAGTSAQAANQSRIDAQTAQSAAASSASVANTSAVNASASASSAQTSAMISSSYSSSSAGVNDKFANWPDAGTNPVGWSQWAGDNAYTIARGAGGSGSAYYARTVTTSDSGNSGFVQAITVGAGKWVISATILLESGSLQGSGVVLGGLGTSISFGTEADNSGLVSTTLLNQMRTWSKLVTVTSAGVVNFHGMHNWGPFGATPQKAMRWYQVSARPANAAEIAGDKALTDTTANTASISTLQQTLTNSLGSLGTRTDTLEAKAANAATTHIVRAKGYYGANPTSGAVSGLFTGNGTRIGVVPARGYNVYIKSLTNDTWVSENFDTFGTASRAIDMGNMLGNAAAGSIVVIISDDEPKANRLQAHTINWVQNSGGGAAFTNPNFKISSAYVLIGTIRGGYGTGIEYYAGSSDYAADAYIDRTFSRNGNSLAIGDATAVLVRDVTSRVTTTESVLSTVQGRTEAYSQKVVQAGLGSAFVTMMAKDDNGNYTSNVGIGAATIALYNQTSGGFKLAMQLSGGNALFTGSLNVGATIRLGSGAGWAVALQQRDFSVGDGETLTYGADLGNRPDFTISTQGMAPLAAGQVYDVRMTDVTSTSAKLYAKIVTPGNTTTLSSAAATYPSSGPTGQATLNGQAEATNGTYYITATVPGSANSVRNPDVYPGSQWEISSEAYLDVWALIGGAWTKITTLSSTFYGSYTTGGAKNIGFYFSGMPINAGAGVTAIGLTSNSISYGSFVGTLNMSPFTWNVQGSSNASSALPSGGKATVTVRPK